MELSAKLLALEPTQQLIILNRTYEQLISIHNQYGKLHDELIEVGGDADVKDLDEQIETIQNFQRTILEQAQKIKAKSQSVFKEMQC